VRSADDDAARSYHIETWGCQRNVHDSEKLAGLLESQGYRRAAGAEQADVILLNTCSIREKAAEKVFSELGRLSQLKRERPGIRLGVCGCVAQQEGERIFERAPYVDFVIGPRAMGSVPGALLSVASGAQRRTVDTAYRRDSIEFPFEAIRREGACPAKAFVTIVEGCNHRCTYCIVPTTRGRETYRDMDDVLAEVAALAARGVLEVEFLGQTVNAYRDAGGRTLADLLHAASRVPGLRRLRFTTSHPSQMTEGLMDAMSACRPVVCDYLHLPVQSGSSTVLRAMRRGYDRAGYLQKVEGLRRRIPDLALGTDLIVGFPGESESDFSETLTLLDDVGFDTVFSYTYSPRPGTASLALGDPVPEGAKRERLGRIQERQEQIQAARNAAWVGRSVEVLVEGPSRRDPSHWSGRTSRNRIVHFTGPGVPGRFETMRIVRASAYSLHAERGAKAFAGDPVPTVY
jgi:tRNA-2-methylthio-N6-dimethylallyladenosine synthase